MSEIYTPAELLARIAFYEGLFYARKDPEDKKVYSSYLIMFNHETDETEFIYLCCPDEFLCEVEEDLEHCTPIAIQICEEDEEAGYPIADFTFLSVEPTIEEEAIIAGMLGLDNEESLFKEIPERTKLPIRPIKVSQTQYK